MLLKEVQTILGHSPFVPLRIRLSDGKTLVIPFREVARLLTYGLLIFKGLKQGTHQAEGYQVVGFDQIDGIEPLARKNARRKKAS